MVLNVPNNANQYLPGVITIPSSMVISAITNSLPMTVTGVLDPVSEANTYVVGQLIKLFVPQVYGMYQANGLQGQITAVNGLQFSLNIDSTNFDPFVIPGNTQCIQPASLSPAGSQNYQFNNGSRQVGFQSLNNRGN